MCLILLCGAAQAEDAPPAERAPDALVRGITERLLSDISSYRSRLNDAKSEAQKDALLSSFYDHITATLEPVVDFRWISLNVMGQHRNEATPEQKERFRKVFTRGLVETYGRGLLTYSDQEILVKPLAEPVTDQRRVAVQQEIKGKDKSYPLLYSMAKNRDGDWKVINVIINGINLGQTFRSQFSQAVSAQNGDLDKVIANWSPEEIETE